MSGVSEDNSLQGRFDELKSHIDMLMAMFFKDFIIDPKTQDLSFQTMEQLNEKEMKALSVKKAIIFKGLFDDEMIKSFAQLGNQLVRARRELAVSASDNRDVDSLATGIGTYLQKLSVIIAAIKLTIGQFSTK